MVKFWDSSAIVDLVIKESRTDIVDAIAREDSDIVVWWGTPVECWSALSRRARDGSLTASDVDAGHRAMSSLLEDAQELTASAALRDRALRVVDAHELTATDALQLAAALIWTHERPAGSGFVCLDRRLHAAAAREGFDVLPRELPGP